jgi:energy-coupling factor transport system permease protein
MVRPQRRPRREVPLLRYLPGTSLVHRADPRAKVLALAAFSLLVTWRPTWTAIGVGFGLVAATFVAARLPLAVLPRPPRILLATLSISGGVALLGEGLDTWGRFVALAVTLVLAGSLLAWTTPLADLAGAVGRLLGPFRRWTLVDEIAVALALAVRALPLLADEVRTLRAAWQSRRPERPSGLKAAWRDGLDLLTSALVAASRRARDMGEALEHRQPRHPRPRR